MSKSFRFRNYIIISFIIIQTSSTSPNLKNKIIYKLLSQPHKHLRHRKLNKILIMEATNGWLHLMLGTWYGDRLSYNIMYPYGIYSSGSTDFMGPSQGPLQYMPGCTLLCGRLINSFSSVIKIFLQYFSIEDTHFMNESFIKIRRTFVKSKVDPGLEL